MSEYEFEMAAEPLGEFLLPRERAELYELMMEDEVTFRHALNSLNMQIQKPARRELNIGELEDYFRQLNNSDIEIEKLIIDTYLDFDEELEDLSDILRKRLNVRGFTSLREAKKFQTRVIDAIYSVYGPFHAQGKWFDIQEQLYIPICSVICKDRAAREAIECEITYQDRGTTSTTVKVKVASAGFGGALSKDLHVSSKYPKAKGIQQVAAPVNLHGRLYVNPTTGERAFRVKIKDIGAPSHIDEKSPNFTEPKVKRWDRGDFGSSVAAGSERTFDVESKASFDAKVPTKIGITNIDLGYTVSRSDALKVHTKATEPGIFEQLSVRNSAFALQFSFKPQEVAAE